MAEPPRAKGGGATSAVGPSVGRSAHNPVGRVRVRRVRLRDLETDDASTVFARLGAIMAACVTPDRDPSDSWAARDWDRRRDVIFDGAWVYLVLAEEEIVGFLAYRHVPLRGRPCLQLLAGYIMPSHQCRGLALAITARIVVRSLARRPWGAHYLVTDALNPIVIEGWRQRIRDPRSFYPDLPGRPSPSSTLVRAAEEFAAIYYPQLVLQSETGVLEARTLPRSHPPPSSGNEQLDQHFSDHVIAGRGDTMLMLLDGSWRVILASLMELAKAMPRAVSLRMRPRRQEHR